MQEKRSITYFCGNLISARLKYPTHKELYALIRTSEIWQYYL
jgi:hypothetical protein